MTVWRTIEPSDLLGPGVLTMQTVGLSVDGQIT